MQLAAIGERTAARQTVPSCDKLGVSLSAMSQSQRPGIPEKALVWVAIIAGAAAIVGISIAFLGPISDVLAHHDVAGLPAKKRPEQLLLELNTVRGMFLKIGAGLFALGAFVYTARNFTLSRRAHELSSQGQLTDRYTKAIDQLGSEEVDVRIGGIYALERIAADSVRDHGVIMEVLTAFVRRKAEHNGSHSTGRPAADIRAAMSVIARRDSSADRGMTIDLHDVDISGINIEGAQLASAMLRGVTLDNAQMSGANLTGATLDSASMANATLTRATLDNAQMSGANLTGATLDSASMANAALTRATLDNAQMSGANLTGATLDSASMANANLTGIIMDKSTLKNAQLSRADFSRGALRLAKFPEANLAGARFFAANLTEVDFTDATLADSDMEEAQAQGAVFVGANLSGASFARADLHGVDLTSLNPTGLDLTGARVAADVSLPPGWRVELQGSGDVVLKRI